MASQFPSHQLSNGLYVSGRPNPHQHPLPPPSAAVFTVADAKNSGDLAKMLDLQNQPPLIPSRSSSSSQPNAGSFRSSRHSGPITTQLQPTGLITSGPPSSSTGPQSGPEPGPGRKKAVYGPAVTNLNGEVRFQVSKGVMWVVSVAAVMVMIVGAFLMVAVERKEVVVVAVAVGGVLVAVVVLGLWNCGWKEKGLVGFLRRCPDAELRGAVDGQYVKVTGVVTCGSIPLESSFQKVPRCVYVSTELYEYRGWGGKSANPKHRYFSWGCRHAEAKGEKCTSLVGTLLRVRSMIMHPLGTNNANANANATVDIVGKVNNKVSTFEGNMSVKSFHIVRKMPLRKYVADFYVSDFQSGFRAQVKTGYGAKVVTFVKPSTIVDITKGNRELSPSFLQWLNDHGLSSDDHMMRLKEGYIKEGSTVTVMGVVRRHGNALMIIPPTQPVSTGCQWARCLLPMYIEGLILTCDENQTADVIPV